MSQLTNEQIDEIIKDVRASPLPKAWEDWFIERLEGRRPKTSPAPTPPSTPPMAPTIPFPKIHATTFLRKNATWTTHVYFSKKLSDDERDNIIQTLVNDGYNTIYLYAANEGDYGGKSVLYTHEDKEWWRAELKKMRRAGITNIKLWLRADDSSGLTKKNIQWWSNFYALVTSDLDDLVDGYVLCLECNEYWSKGLTLDLVNELRKYTDQEIGVHTGSIKTIDWAENADAFYLQTGFDASENEIAEQVGRARKKFPNKKIYCAEYDKSGETDRAKKKGDRAIDAGADGVGGGCGREKMKVLYARLHAAPDASKPQETSPSQGGHTSLLSNAKWIKGRPGKITASLNAIRFYRQGGHPWIELAYDRLPWPHVTETKDGKKKNIDAWTCVFALRDGVWVGGRVEQNKVGDTHRDLKNEEPGDYLPGITFKKGERVLVCLIPKKESILEMSNAVEGVWP